VLPDYCVEEKHALVRVMQNVEVPSFDTYFCYPEAMRGSARLRAFRDFMISKARLWQY
jgi:DNA-binding transcriptional LysR family regulator